MASPPSVEHVAVQRAVLDGFEQVGLPDGFGLGEVGDGAGDLEDAVVGAGGQRELFHGLLEQVAHAGIERAVALDLRRGHTGVGREARAAETDELVLAGQFDALAHGGGRLAGLVGAQLGDGERRRLDMDVDAIEQRSADAGAVALDLGRRAPALVLRIAEVAARAFVCCQCVT